MYIDGILDEFCPEDCPGCSCYKYVPCVHCTEHCELEEED
jgi:hypothetical protein